MKKLTLVVMNKIEIEKYFKELNQELAKKNIKGEACLYGGAVFCLAFDARPSTKDVDAVFKPAKEIREAAVSIAQRYNLREDWFNDGVKGFVTPHEQRIYLDYSNLKIFIPEPDYLLAMKAMAARVDGTDRNDIEFLIKKLEIKTPQDIFRIIEKYYSKQTIKPATQFFIEEIFQK